MTAVLFVKSIVFAMTFLAFNAHAELTPKECVMNSKAIKTLVDLRLMGRSKDEVKGFIILSVADSKANSEKHVPWMKLIDIVYEKDPSSLLSWQQTVFAICVGAQTSTVLGSSDPASASTKGKLETSKLVGDPYKGLRKQYDKMEGISWYAPATAPKFANSNAFYLSFGRNDDGRFSVLHLVARYSATDWLFVTHAWAKADGERVDVPQKSTSPVKGWQRDNRNGDIWEYCDAELISTAEIAAVRRIANAKNVTVRYVGRQYNKDITLSEQELKSMRDVIAAYETATGKAWR